MHDTYGFNSDHMGKEWDIMQKTKKFEERKVKGVDELNILILDDDEDGSVVKNLQTDLTFFFARASEASASSNGGTARLQQVRADFLMGTNTGAASASTNWGTNMNGEIQDGILQCGEKKCDGDTNMNEPMYDPDAEYYE